MDKLLDNAVDINLVHKAEIFCAPLLMKYSECSPNFFLYILHAYDKESWDLNNEEKTEAAGTKKEYLEEWNALFRLSKYARASKRYEKAANFIDYDTSFSLVENKQSKQLNNAACKLKPND